MKYPAPGDYQEAVQFPEAAFADPDLKEAEPQSTLLGLPEAITGAFAVVFPVRVRGIRWAVKCFLTDVHDQHERYRAIARVLSDEAMPFTIHFDYQTKGIHVNGRSLPILKMEWADGVSIARFVDEHLQEPDALKRLLEVWRAVIRRLESAGVAHGDLQHGNILVDGDANLTLVDYDTMYVPPLRGKKSPEVGHRNYQHPDRDEADFGPYIDRFSALVIDTALQACIHMPGLWERYSSGENLLFKAADFFDPDTSPLFDELMLAPDGLRAQADVLRRACRAEPEDVPSLAEVMSGEVSIMTAGQRRRTSQEQHGVSRTPFERWFAPAGTIAVIASLVVAAVVSPIALAVVPVAIAGGLAWAAWRYRRLPAVRRLHRLRKEEAYFARLIRSLDDERAELLKTRDAFTAQMESEYERRLEEVQESALRNRLKHHFIGEARDFEGITHKVVVRLKLEGIRTAYQATPDRIRGILQLSDESKAHIGLWRASLVSEYRDDIPTELSPAEERRVRRSIEVRLEEMDAEIARLGRKIDIQQAERDQLRMRMDETQAVSFPKYLLFLLRVRGYRSEIT